MAFQIGQHRMVREWQLSGMIPIMLSGLDQSPHHVFGGCLDGQLPPLIETSRTEIDRSDNGALFIRYHDLAMKLEVFEHADLGSDIMHDAQPAHALEQFLAFELVQRARHDADANAAIDRAYQPLDDDHVLIPFVLQPKRFLRAIDEGYDTLTAVIGTPDQAGAGTRLEWRFRPVSVEASNHLATSAFVVISTA